MGEGLVSDDNTLSRSEWIILATASTFDASGAASSSDASGAASCCILLLRQEASCVWAVGGFLDKGGILNAASNLRQEASSLWCMVNVCHRAER